MKQQSNGGMRMEIDGEQYRLTFRHDQDFKTVEKVTKFSPGAAERGDAGSLRMVKVAVPFKATAYPGVRARLARAATRCAIVRGRRTETGPEPTAVGLGIALCSASEQTFDKEYSRQLAFARALTEQPVPYRIAARLWGLYMSSGRRAIKELHGVVRLGEDELFHRAAWTVRDILNILQDRDTIADMEVTDAPEPPQPAV